MSVLGRLGQRLNAAGVVTIERLKWSTIVLPFVALLVLVALLRSSLHDWLHEFPEVFFLAGLFAACVFGFASVVFALIEAQEARVLEQNRVLAELLRRTERQNLELTALLSVSRASSAPISLDRMYEEALTAVRAFTGADAVELWLTEDGSLVLAGGEGSPSGEALVREAASRGSTVVKESQGRNSVRAIPFWLRGSTVGVLVVTAPDDAAFAGPDEQRVLEGIGRQIALGVENARLHDQVLDRAVLEERERIARELHDGLAQVLGFINTQSQAARKLLADGRLSDTASELEAMTAASREVYADVREAILGLRGTTRGLIPTLRDYVERMPRAGDCEVELRIRSDAEGVVLSPPAEIQLLRIVQEALSNARKHARATRIEVDVDADAETLGVEVADDGRGFDPLVLDSRGWPRFGLQTMRERAHAIGGTFEIRSSPGRGSSVVVRVPRVAERETVGASAAG